MPTHRCFAIISTFSLASLCLQICKPSFLLRWCLSMFFIQNCDQINETLEDCTFIFKRSKKTDYDQKCYLSYDNPHRNQTINSFKVQSHLKERKNKKIQEPQMWRSLQIVQNSSLSHGCLSVPNSTVFQLIRLCIMGKSQPFPISKPEDHSVHVITLGFFLSFSFISFSEFVICFGCAGCFCSRCVFSWWFFVFCC